MVERVAQIRQKIVQIVVDTIGVDTARVEAAHNFEQLGVDSLDMLEIIMKIEEEFRIEIPDDAAQQICSLEQTVLFVLQAEQAR